MTEPENLIEKHYMYLTYHLRPSIPQIVRYLHEEQVVSTEKAEKIMSQAANTMKVQHLLDNLKTLGTGMSDSLYAATLFTKLWPAADILESKKRPHKDLEKPMMPLPDQWPTGDQNESLARGILDIKPVETDDTNMMEYYKNPSKFNVYDMRKEIKGHVLIINNKKFTHLKDRSGTDHDSNGLRILFENLKFQVKVKDNQTTEEMDKLIQEECEADHSEYNCFILVILSHGLKDGVVTGVDYDPKNPLVEKLLRTESIKRRFVNVESLKQKPKLFIIQACRGTGTTGIVRAGDPGKGDLSDEEDKKTESDFPEVEGDAGSDSDDEDFDSDLEADGPSESDQPHSDEDLRFLVDENNRETPLHFLVALPTTEGNRAWRDRFKGTWFIQAFIYVMANYAYKEDILTLFYKVNALVRKAKGGPVQMTQEKPNTKNKKKKEKKHSILTAACQVPEVSPSLLKRLFFFPGITE